MSSSQSSQSSASLPEQERSIWLDEKEEQNNKRKALNEVLTYLTDGRCSPLQSTLNTEWNDISSTQQKYYLRKAKEVFHAALSVVSPGQEGEIWKAVRQDSELEDQQSKVKQLEIDSNLMETLIKAHSELQSWQSKRQILSLFCK